MIYQDNILITDEGRVQIADFGLAALVSIPRTTENTPSGTAQYMAPERFFEQNGRRDFRPSKEGDVWGFGCVTYAVSPTSSGWAFQFS